jgi:uncharacterized membrane protein YfcA
MIWPEGIELDFDTRFFALMAIVFIAGIIRGFTGFGSALLAVPALAVLYGPKQAVVIEVLIEVPVVLGLIPTALREAERKTVLPILGMFAIFVPVGALLLTVINPVHVKIIISIFVLSAVGVMSQQSRLVGLVSPRANYIIGAFSGMTQGLTGMAGPLFATALVARGENATLTRANISALAAGIIALSVVSFVALGLVTRETVLYALLASPAILLGVWTGARLFRRFAHQNLRGPILVFLALTALWTLYQTLV